MRPKVVHRPDDLCTTRSKCINQQELQPQSRPHFSNATKRVEFPLRPVNVEYVISSTKSAPIREIRHVRRHWFIKQPGVRVCVPASKCWLSYNVHNELKLKRYADTLTDMAFSFTSHIPGEGRLRPRCSRLQRRRRLPHHARIPPTPHAFLQPSSTPATRKSIHRESIER